MSSNSSPSARPVRALPARPSLEYLKNEAKQRLKVLQTSNPQVRLATAQLTLAREYGFGSWRQMKAHVDKIETAPPIPELVFEAARAGDVEAVRHALNTGFDPGLTDSDGRTIHQIAKENGHEAIELLAREFQERETRPPEEQQSVDAVIEAAEKGLVDELRHLLDTHPDLINARGGNFQQQTALHKAAWRNQHACVRLLLDRGADVRIRDYGDNAYALHFAAEAADFEIVQMLVEAGSDVVGEGDDHQLGVLGWATCFRRARADIADYLLDHGAKLNLWAAIALGWTEDVRNFVVRDPSWLSARMSRNEHHRTALHHAAANNQPEIVRLLIGLGADPNASDATNATPLTTAAQENADEIIISMLLQAGARLDFIAAVNLKRYDLAEDMLRENPLRIGRDGQDTIALHLAVSKKSVENVRWLIDHGVDVNAKRTLWDCNYTALHITAADGTVEIAQMLMDAGADPSIHDDKYDNTPLGWADFCGQEQVAQFLRTRGVGR
jgi:ankyrin repeat protein